MAPMDRRRRAESYPWLLWKVRLFAVGAVTAVAGMALGMDWLVGIAIVLLAGAFLIRFLPGGQGTRADEEEGSEG